MQPITPVIDFATDLSAPWDVAGKVAADGYGLWGEPVVLLQRVGQVPRAVGGGGAEVDDHRAGRRFLDLQ